MNENEFNTIAEFVQKSSGIVLSKSKEYLVESRLASVVEQFNFDDVSALARGLRMAPEPVKSAVVDAMTTNESFFFRDKTPFAHFENVILPAICEARKNMKRIRIWCAAASTGQEPYSLAMLLLAHKRLWQGMDVQIIGTDISPTAIARAKEGRYSQFEVQRGLPVKLMVEHFTQDGAQWVISNQLRRMVKFSEMNLLKPFTNVGNPDIVFCRNVLIYFDIETKRDILRNIHTAMKSDGFLVMGAAETMMGLSEDFQRAPDQRGLYQPGGAVLAQKLSA